MCVCAKFTLKLAIFKCICDGFGKILVYHKYKIKGKTGKYTRIHPL
jgi:hypothetical protein